MNKFTGIVVLVLSCIIIASICAFALAESGNWLQTRSGESEFGQFPPYTDAERELEKMLHRKDENVDLAKANWLIAADIPQFRDVTCEAYLNQVDGLTERVRRDMVAMRASGRRRANPDNPIARCGNFVDAMHKLGFAYAEEFREENLMPLQEKAMYADANNIFLVGLLRTQRGSCVSMPLIYLVIGRRLGLPVHLVNVGKHYFIRWEEPGLRMNIETTITGPACLTADDSVYLETEGLTRERLTGNQLRNLSSREVIGDLLFTRSAYWVMTTPKSRSRSWVDLSRAFRLSPEDYAIQRTHQAVFSHYGITSEDNLDILKQKEKNSI